MKIATIKTLVRAAGWKPAYTNNAYTSNDVPPPSAVEDGLALAKRKGICVAPDGRCYVPYQRFLPRRLRRNPKAPG